MCDEMYLQKGTHYLGGNYVGAVGHGNILSGIFLFMIVESKTIYQLFEQLQKTKSMEIGYLMS